MAQFQYSALDAGGREATGAIEAASRNEAIADLAQRGLYVTHMDAEGNLAPVARSLVQGFGRRLSARVMAGLWRQLATAVEAGLPLLTALRVTGEQSDHARLRELLDDLARRVAAGESLSGAMAAQGGRFTRMQVSMVRAGETAGVLDDVLASLAEFAERELDIRERIRSAATYPTIVLALAVISVIVIMTFILPRILNALVESGATLPAPTRLLMGFSGLLQTWGWLIALLLVAAGAGFRAWVGMPTGRLAFDRFKLRIPILGPTLLKVAVARFARALGTLSRSGIEIIEALQVLRDTLGNEALAQAVDEVRSAITEGQSIAAPLGQTGMFPPMFIQIVDLGERTGRLDELLLRCADAYDKECTAAIGRAMTVIPALFIVALALLIGFILAAVLLPIVSMQSGLAAG